VRALVDLLLPPRCLACGRVGAEPLCPGCDGRLVPDGEGHELAPGVVAVAPFAYADPLAAAIKRVKTDALRAGAAALAALLAPHLPTATPRTWVPAPAARRRRRGLDLPEHLAGRDAVRLLRATGERADHGHLGAAARRAGVVGAYAAVAPVPPAVVLVDDVRATGATLQAAAAALRGAGARRVLAVTLAAAPGRPSAAATPAGPRADAPGRRPPPRAPPGPPAGEPGRASPGASARSSRRPPARTAAPA
jgi:predicted amidophosphoribosyltransferase